MSTKQPIDHFSTRLVPPQSRFDFFVDVLQQSLWQVTGWDRLADEFFVDMRQTPLGCLTAVSEKICAHHSHRTLADVGRSAERSFHLFVATHEPWAFTHRGRHERLFAGDVVIIGEGEHETHAPHGFEGLILKCPEHWVKTWVADPELITGRRIGGDSPWGRVLSPTLRQLTPEFASALPVPAEVVVDHIGAVLAMLADDGGKRAVPELAMQVRRCIRERCHEDDLTAQQVAATLDIPVAVLHHSLAGGRTTFARDLVKARSDRSAPRKRAAAVARPVRPSAGKRATSSPSSVSGQGQIRSKRVPEAPPTGGMAPSALQRVRQYIEDHLGEHLDVEHLATLTTLSSCHFSRAFKQSTGMPPHRYLVSRRVQAAARLIESTDRPMSEIALEAGFADQSHFTRVFSAHVGESPRQFRHRHR